MESTYLQTLDFLFSRLPMFSRVGASAYKPSLDNTIALCAALGNPQNNFPSIHIAGTNGKGSVSHMLAAIFQTAGYKTGLYTSPHLKDFRERIKVNGKMVDQHFVVDFTERISREIDKLAPSFFEITVGMAFDYFSKEKVEIAIIETGLGGRLDSTNVITPEVSVITNIGWDHMNLLGDTLEKIAFEKSGIIKPGVPIVLGEHGKETDAVFEKVAGEKNSPLTVASKKRQVIEWHWEKHEMIAEVAEDHKTDHKIYRLDLPGLYQAKNLVTVLEVCAVLKQSGWALDDDVVYNALHHVKKITGLYGRWDIIDDHPMVVLDVAHNEDGVRQILNQVELTDHHELHIIMGMVNDKEIDAVLRLLPATANYYFTQAKIPRALPSETLMNIAQRHGLQGKTYTDVNMALDAARSAAGKQDLILVCGSVFLVAEVNRNGEQ